MNYKDKIRAMQDSELEEELERVIQSRANGYQMLGSGKDLMIEASILLADKAIGEIKEEINSRKA